MEHHQIQIDFETTKYNKSDIIENIYALMTMYRDGKLGGDIMPEDAKPKTIDNDSADNYHFLTLPMALNYQRNSYKLWESASQTYLDKDCNGVFHPNVVSNMSTEELRSLLLKYKVALQPNKHIETWQRIAKAIANLYGGDIRNLFISCNNDIIKIREIIQGRNKKDFPYLSGHKIFNYWLHVIEIYTSTKFINRYEISIAPDTHIIQSSIRLGLVDNDYNTLSQNRSIVADAWKDMLHDTDIAPIDIHTPLWLWSRKGFPSIEKKHTRKSRDGFYN